jgi:hypothetical protein
MSIIFQKLNTLKKDSASPEEFNRKRLQNGIPVYTFKKLIFSPMGVLTISITLLAFGMISFYALSLLKGSLDSASGAAIVVAHQTKAIEPEELPSSKEETSPPETDGPGNTLVYIPKPVPDGSLDEKSPVLLKKPQVSGSPTESGPPVKNRNISLRPETSPPEVKIQAQQDALRAAKEKRTQKTSAITLLAEDLEEAIGKDDTLRTHLLFDALAKENGPGSIYYLKLKAFQDIREENYEPAKRTLNQILDLDMNDFDANFNMAVIEIREQKLNAAKQRLIRLKEIHPSRAAIDDLLNSF